MFSALVHTVVLLLAATAALAAPASGRWPRFTVPQSHFEVLSMRGQAPLNPAAMVEATCIDRNAHIVFHDQNAAELAICGGIAGPVAACRGAPATTVGEAGSARFSLRATVEGAAITIAKAKWEQCVRAARDKCPTGSVRAVCAGGATAGNVEFTLDNAQNAAEDDGDDDGEL